MSWPGLLLVLLLGLLAGAVLAFFRARVISDVGRYLIVGIVGFAGGQVLSLLRPIASLEIGIVNVAYGIIGVMVASYIAARLRLT